ncbi:MAG: HD domain-containing protein [Hydrogenibacillus schlegelii]|uniref:HD domain-containing protein n=1 Tax=Hydrogenibacillus schlegelii TaxID=1484 RepID=A0A947G9U3_HYDSH|nr:HD domain-containing protein [Hydrogenibacillus schlegelii]
MRLVVGPEIVGRVLARPVELPDGGRLLSAGRRLEESDVAYLRAFGVTAVEVDEEPGAAPARAAAGRPASASVRTAEGVRPPADRLPETPRPPAPAHEGAWRAAVEGALRRTALGAPPPIADLRAIVRSWFAEDARPTAWVRLVRVRPEAAEDPAERLAVHALSVGRLAAALARLLGLADGEVMQVALAGLLADVGMWRLPPRLLRHPGVYAPEERRDMERHTALGYERLKGRLGLSPEAALAALLHHERMNGSGYPSGLPGERIPLLVRIVAAADSLAAGASARPYRPAKSWWTIVSEIAASAAYDLALRQAMLESIRRLPAGTTVRLADGRTARLLRVDAARPLLWELEADGAPLPLSALPDVVAVDPPDEAGG